MRPSAAKVVRRTERLSTEVGRPAVPAVPAVQIGEPSRLTGATYAAGFSVVSRCNANYQRVLERHTDIRNRRKKASCADTARACDEPQPPGATRCDVLRHRPRARQL